jgi:hypothetical protein
MRFLKSSLSNSQRENGSAVLEFIVVVIPATIMVLTLQGLFGLAFSIQALEQQSYELARYAALADVTEAEVTQYVNRIAPDVTISKVFDDQGCFYLARKEGTFQIWAWPWPIDFSASGKASCEI